MKGFKSGKTWRQSASQMAIGAALGLVLIASQPALAVETTAAIRGVVAGAAAGSKVTVVNAENGAKASANVRADGTYDLVGLRPGTYEVTIKGADGKTLRETVILAVGETTTLESDMGKATEEVVVTGRRKEVKTSELATSVSKSQMENLPQNGRNFLNFAALAPGVTVSLDPERKTFQSGALSANSVNVFIDGLSQKNQVLQGGVAGQDASRGNPFPQGAIQEYKVSTQNFKAEYEQAASAIITAVTISGTNQFRGEVFANYQSKDMIGQPYYQRGATKPDYSNKEYGATLSGPIIKDKLFWATSLEFRRDARPTDPVVMPSAAALAGNSALASALASAYNGVYAKDFSQDTYWGKLTYLATDNDTVDFAVKYRLEDDVRGFGGTTAKSRGNSLDQDQTEISLQWKHRGENYLNEMSVDSQQTHWKNSPLTDGPAITLLGNPSNLNSVVATFGGIPYAQEKSQESVSFKDNVTFTGIEWNGRHTVKAGVKFARYEYLAMESIPTANPELFYDAATYVLGGSSNTPVTARVMDGDPEITSSNNQFGIFVQDDWVFDKHWTFNLGIRWDYESNMMNNKFVTPADIITAIKAHVGFNKAFNVNDYISTGSNREAFKGAFQPRLGFSYDKDGDGQTVFFGGFGRYYDRNIFDMAQLEQRRATLHNAQINFSTSVPWNASYFSNPSQLVTLAKTLGLKGEIILMNNDVGVPYSDQFNVGVRKKFGKIQTSATLAHIESYDLFNWVLANRQSDGTWGNAWDGTHGDQFQTQPWGDGVPGYGNFIVSTSDRRARTTSLYLTAEKAYTKNDGYGWTAKLDLNNAEMTGHNDPFLFDYANATAGGWHNAEGVEKWHFFGTAIWDIPWNMKLSGALSMGSGTPFTQIGFFPNGAGGNTLRTIDFNLWPKTKIGYKQLDLKLAKEFAMPNGQSLLVEGQVYNVFDWVNRTYSGWGGGFTNAGQQPSYAPDNNTTGPARTYMVGVKYKW